MVILLCIAAIAYISYCYWLFFIRQLLTFIVEKDKEQKVFLIYFWLKNKLKMKEK